MKLQARRKGVSDVAATRGRREAINLFHQFKLRPDQKKTLDSIEDLFARDKARKEQASISPLSAKAAGMGYIGPVMPDKGKKNGSCNVTACQVPLAGQPQFFMDGRPWSHIDERKYYCADCERGFTKWDLIDRPGLGLRCTPDEDNEALA